MTHRRGAGARLAEVPITFRDRRVGNSKMSRRIIVRFKVNAFLALLITSILVGLAAGVPLATIPATEDCPRATGHHPRDHRRNGRHARLRRHPGGARIDARRIIELSGGASSLAGRFTKLLGPRRVSGALTAAALVLAIPVFFDVGFIILVPIIYGFSHAAGLNPVKFGLPIAGSCSPSTSPCRRIRESSAAPHSSARMSGR